MSYVRILVLHISIVYKLIKCLLFPINQTLICCEFKKGIFHGGIKQFIITFSCFLCVFMK